MPGSALKASIVTAKGRNWNQVDLKIYDANAAFRRSLDGKKTDESTEFMVEGEFLERTE